MNMDNHDIHISIPVTAEKICGVLITACEGGINYWCDKVRPHREADMKRHKDVLRKFEYGYLPLALIDDAGLEFNVEDKWVLLTRNKIALGIQAMVEKCPHHFADFFKEGGDATTADVFIQMCLFGEIIYS
jgi:hypothetical protein